MGPGAGTAMGRQALVTRLARAARRALPHAQATRTWLRTETGEGRSLRRASPGSIARTDSCRSGWRRHTTEPPGRPGTRSASIRPDLRSQARRSLAIRRADDVRPDSPGARAGHTRPRPEAPEASQDPPRHSPDFRTVSLLG